MRRSSWAVVGVVCGSVLWGGLAGPARADVLELADGRAVEGLVTQDGDVYRVVSRFGEAEFAAKDVRAWQRGKSVEDLWRERSAALAPDDHAGRASLAQWLAAQGRDAEARAIAEQVVAADPENAVAHAVLGHVRHRGTWMSPDDAKRADGLERHGDAWYTPEEWARLDAEKRATAEEAARKADGKRVAAAVDAAARLLVAPDPALRAEGRRRLEALAAETKTEAIRRVIPELEAFAAAADRYAAAVRAGESKMVLSECRIQLARLKRPIREFQTALGSNLGQASVKIQLPEIELIKIGTTVPIPAR